MYDDLIGTFTKTGYVDEETQKNDYACCRSCHPSEPNDLSFVRQAEQQLGKAGSRDMKI
jgi:hypothetical protein